MMDVTKNMKSWLNSVKSIPKSAAADFAFVETRDVKLVWSVGWSMGYENVGIVRNSIAVDKHQVSGYVEEPVAKRWGVRHAIELDSFNFDSLLLEIDDAWSANFGNHVTSFGIPLLKCTIMIPSYENLMLMWQATKPHQELAEVVFTYVTRAIASMDQNVTLRHVDVLVKPVGV